MFRKKRLRSSLDIEDDSVGFCICPNCNYTIPHRVGVPCRGQMCPHCNISLVRSEKMVKNADCENNINAQKRNETVFPKISSEICIGCESCVDMCPRHAIIMDDGKAFILENICGNCRACVPVCPVGAIN